jgi:hypothetical protein
MGGFSRIPRRIRHVLPRTWSFLVRDKKNDFSVLSLISSTQYSFPRDRRSISPPCFTPNTKFYMASENGDLGAFRDGSADGVGRGADLVSSLEQTRGYQMEMFQESLRRNIIVAVRSIKGPRFYLGY